MIHRITRWFSWYGHIVAAWAIGILLVAVSGGGILAVIAHTKFQADLFAECELTKDRPTCYALIYGGHRE